MRYTIEIKIFTLLEVYNLNVKRKSNYFES